MEHSDFFAEYAQEEKRIAIENNDTKKEFKQKLKGLINITGLFRWMDEGHDYWLPLGIFDIKNTGEFKHGYGDKLTGRVDNEDYKHHLYLHHKENEIRGVNHYYVWQQGYDDSYNGYLLWPLKNGKYLLVEYSC